MPVESAADLACFFNVEEFAELAIYTPVGGAPLPAFAVVHSVLPPPESPSVHHFLIRVADVPVPIVGDLLLLGDVRYQIAADPKRVSQSLAWWCIAIPCTAEVVFQRSSGETEDAFGKARPMWAEYSRVWAAIRYAEGKEERTAAHEAGAAAATFSVARTATMAGLRVTDRLLFDDADWDISSVTPSRQFGDGAIDVVATRAAR